MLVDRFRRVAKRRELTDGSDVAPIVVAPPDDLGGNRVRRPHRLVVHLPEREVLAQAEVDNLELSTRLEVAEEKVLELFRSDASRAESGAGKNQTRLAMRTKKVSKRS